MKTIDTIFLTTILFFSCNNVDKTNEDNSIKLISPDIKTTTKVESDENYLKELFTDSINHLTIGDCFILRSEKLSKGFVLTRIRKDLYDFTPILLDSTKKDLGRFTNGSMRMVPIATMNGKVEHWGTECLSLMGQKDVRVFLKEFKKVGRLEFKDEAPSVSSSAYVPEYSAGELGKFFKEQEMMWINQNKTVDLASLILEK